MDIPWKTYEWWRVIMKSSMSLLGIYVPGGLDPSAPSQTRRWFAEVAAGLGFSSGQLDDATLMLSELVTNALVHSKGLRSVVAATTQDGVRVEVLDLGGGSAPVEPGKPDLEDEGGRGLLIVGRLASSWGIRAENRGLAVWFELALETGA